MKSQFKRAVVTAMCPLMVLSGMPAPAQAAREVACESHGMRRAYCSTGPHGDIRLISNSGLWPCKQGETWGIETEGIWVDQNCKGRFAVDDAKSSDNKGAIVAGVIGLGILAAIAANHAKKDDDRYPDDRPPPPRPDWDDRPPPGRPGWDRPPPGGDWGRPDEPPNWMVGEYAGWNNFYNSELNMSVAPRGRIQTRSGKNVQWGRYIDRRTIQFEDGKRFDVDRTRHGVRLTEYGNPRNSNELRRVR